MNLLSLGWRATQKSIVYTRVIVQEHYVDAGLDADYRFVLQPPCLSDPDATFLSI